MKTKKLSHRQIAKIHGDLRLLGMSKGEFADELGCKQSKLSAYFNGEAMTMERFIKIKQFLNWK